MKFTIGTHQRIEAICTIEATRVGQHPCTRTAECVGLQSPLDIARAGHCRDRHLPEKGDIPRRILFDFALEIRCGRFYLQSRKLACSRSWTRDRRGESTTIAEQSAVVFRTNLFGSKAREVHRLPEAVVSTLEVVTCSCSTHARIYSAKYQRQTWLQNIWKRLSVDCATHE